MPRHSNDATHNVWRERERERERLRRFVQSGLPVARFCAAGDVDGFVEYQGVRVRPTPTCASLSVGRLAGF